MKKMTSGKRGRGGKMSRSSADRSFEQENDNDSSSSSSDEERVVVKKRKYSKRVGSSAGVGWSREEELKLKKLKGDGLAWEEIAKSFPGRSKGACQSRFTYHVNEAEKRAPWSSNDDNQLKKLRESGLTWKEIAKSFPGRSEVASRTRYSVYVNEAEKIARWSSQDDKQLKKLKEKDGMVWKEIAKSFPGRSKAACELRYSKYVKKGIVPRSKALPARASNSTGRSRRSSNNNKDDDDDESNSSSSEDDDNDEVAASDPSLAPPHDDDVLPPVISSSSFAALTYYPPPLPPRSQRRKFGSSGARRDEKLISEFCCFICTRLIFRAQVMRPCGCHVFCEECVPPIDARTSACYTCSTPFEQALPYRTGNNIAEQMVRARFVKADVAAEWKSRGAEYARDRNGGR
jgi:hypothetical protein